MDLDRTTRESLIVKLVYKPRRYSIRRAEARKACVPLNNVSEFTRSRRMATSRPGRNILNDASLSNRRSRDCRLQATPLLEAETDYYNASIPEDSETNIIEYQEVLPTRNSRVKPIDPWKRIGGHDSVLSIDEDLLVGLQKIAERHDLFTTWVWGARSLMHHSGMRSCYVDLETVEEIPVAAWRHMTPKAIIVASLPEHMNHGGLSRNRLQVVLRPTKPYTRGRITNFLRPGWTGWRWETFSPMSTTTRTILRVVTDVPYREYEKIVDLAGLLEQSRNSNPYDIVGSDVVINPKDAAEEAQQPRETDQAGSSEPEMRCQREVRRSAYNLDETIKPVKRARRSKMARAATIDSDEGAGTPNASSHNTSTGSMQATRGATRAPATNRVIFTTTAQDFLMSPSPAESSVATTAEPSTATTQSSITATESSATALLENLAPTTTTTTTPTPLTNSPTIKVIFQNSRDETIDEEVFSECADARSFFDRAIVADIATKETRLLQVQIGGATGYIRRDNEVDFERRVVGRLALMEGSCGDGALSAAAAVVVKHYR